MHGGELNLETGPHEIRKCYVLGTGNGISLIWNPGLASTTPCVTSVWMSLVEIM